jgi:hypothetical protein
VAEITQELCEYFKLYVVKLFVIVSVENWFHNFQSRKVITGEEQIIEWK